jgi:hypothetical protein
VRIASHLASWLDDSPGSRLIDLAATLHREQPFFPFRVGLVAASPADLAASLRACVRAWSEAPNGPWGDLSDVYAFEEPTPLAARAPLCVGSIEPEHFADSDTTAFLHRVRAWRFARCGEGTRDPLGLDRAGRILDLSLPADPSSDGLRNREAPIAEPIDALAEILKLRSHLIDLMAG